MAAPAAARWVSTSWGVARATARPPRVVGRQPNEAPQVAVTRRTSVRAASAVAPTTSVSRSRPPATSQAAARAIRSSPRGEEMMVAGTGHLCHGIARTARLWPRSNRRHTATASTCSPDGHTAGVEAGTICMT